MRSSLRAQAAIEWKGKPSTAGRMHAQAAMEYLVTYGWALLALFAVVAILVSTGAFSSANFSQQECTFQPGIPCSPFIIYKNGDVTSIRFSMANDLGFPIKIASATLTTSDMGEAGRVVYSIPSADLPQGIIEQSGQMDFFYDFAGPSQPYPRDFRTVVATIQYYNCKGIDSPGNCNDPESLYTTSGRISSVVEQGS